jgi:pyruvate-ferredoxin/flavodoxin oxidoreductase
VAQAFILDANEAAADVAYRCSEVATIYPITPASPMGEYADAWSAKHRKNLWGSVVRVVEMQSEAGAAGALHGALQGGTLATTYTASQGLLLMLPDMFKIAGELTPAVIHVAARSLATHALSIFGDHSDVYAARSTGFAMLCARTPQEAHDLAAVSSMATLTSRIPFLHFFDGFRTSHELNRVEKLSDTDLLALLPEDAIEAHRNRSLSPERPVVRGTAQNPDTFFQAREACNPFYDACPARVEEAFAAFAARTGRQYKPFEYFGAPDADRVIVIMGSGALAAEETAAYLNAKGERVGVISVRLFRPFSTDHLVAMLPPTCGSVIVLDRAKEPGATGEPLFLDVLCALRETRPMVRVVGGRFGLSSKEFTPAMVKGVFDQSRAGTLKQGFTVGIVDDVTYRSINYDETFDLEPADVVRAVFYGLGSDGTVGANKNSAQILGEADPGEETRYAQGYFVYDSKKAGAVTVSHLRFGPKPINSSYLIRNASFVACHQWAFLERLDVLSIAAKGATVLLNAPLPADQVWAALPVEVQQQIIEKELQVHVIDAVQVAREAGGARRMNPVNTIMQCCFFALSGVLPREQAIERIRAKIKKSYGGKGDEVVKVNLDAVDAALNHLHPLPIPAGAPESKIHRRATVPPEAPDFVQRVTAAMIAGQGDRLPVSAFPPDGTWPVSTTRWEKRNIALEIPVWDSDICIQCNKCALICPHAAIRTQAFDASLAPAAPATFKTTPFKGKEFGDNFSYTVQVAPEDCTGCGLCVAYCPVKDKKNPRHKAIDMVLQAPLREAENENFAHFMKLPDPPRTQVPDTLKGSQFLRPLFEFSGACAGCGETPYIKLITQLFGDRTVISNATGCSSIYGGNLPTTPYCTNAEGRGPAWVNSLFEDNAEMGLGVRLALDQRAEQARYLLANHGVRFGAGDTLMAGLLAEQGASEVEVAAQRERVLALKAVLSPLAGKDAEARRLLTLSDDLVRRVVWIIGGDGWAYDIGYGGLDHVLASGANVNIIVLDTEVYSNTGGQASKSTPIGAVAKFAADGKSGQKKNLGLLAMMHEHVYVAQVALGAKDAHTHKALMEAESWHGPSIVIAYSPCIAHGYDLVHGPDQEKLAVETGYWPLFRYDPRRKAEGKQPLILDSAPPKTALGKFTQNETRFQVLMRSDPERATMLLGRAQEQVNARFELLARLAGGAATE